MNKNPPIIPKLPQENNNTNPKTTIAKLTNTCFLLIKKIKPNAMIDKIMPNINSPVYEPPPPNESATAANPKPEASETSDTTRLIAPNTISNVRLRFVLGTTCLYILPSAPFILLAKKIPPK